MRVTIHGELVEDCINNRNFAQYASASAYDTLGEIAVKTNCDSDFDSENWITWSKKWAKGKASFATLQCVQNLKEPTPPHPLLQEKYTGLETARLWKMFFWS